MGDLILTCTGDLSRNRRVGLALAQGKPLDTIVANSATWPKACPAPRPCANWPRRLGVDMPITNAVAGVLFDGDSAQRDGGQVVGAGSARRAGLRRVHVAGAFRVGPPACIARTATGCHQRDRILRCAASRAAPRRPGRHLVRPQHGRAAVRLERRFLLPGTASVISPSTQCSRHRLFLRHHEPDQFHVVGLDQRHRGEIGDVVFAALKCDPLARFCMVATPCCDSLYSSKFCGTPRSQLTSAVASLNPRASCGTSLSGALSVQLYFGPDEKLLSFRYSTMRMVRIESLRRALQLVFGLQVAIGWRVDVYSSTFWRNLSHR